jgi:hypothetical protein
MTGPTDRVEEPVKFRSLRCSTATQRFAFDVSTQCHGNRL